MKTLIVTFSKIEFSEEKKKNKEKESKRKRNWKQFQRSVSQDFKLKLS